MLPPSSFGSKVVYSRVKTLTLIFILISAAAFAVEPMCLSEKSIKLMQYHAPPIKFHHQFRLTIKVASNSKVIDEFMVNGIDGFVEQLASDPMEALPELMKYNVRFNAKTKSGRFKVFFGKQLAPNDAKNTSNYIGFRIRF